MLRSHLFVRFACVGVRTIFMQPASGNSSVRTGEAICKQHFNPLRSKVLAHRRRMRYMIHAAFVARGGHISRHLAKTPHSSPPESVLLMMKPAIRFLSMLLLAGTVWAGEPPADKPK